MSGSQNNEFVSYIPKIEKGIHDYSQYNAIYEWLYPKYLQTYGTNAGFKEWVQKKYPNFLNPPPVLPIPTSNQQVTNWVSPIPSVQPYFYNENLVMHATPRKREKK